MTEGPNYPNYPSYPSGSSYPPPGSPFGGPGLVERRNGLGVAALVLGIISVVLSWTVLGGVLLGLAAIVLGILGRRRVRRRQATNGGMALTGIITGFIGVVIAGLLIAAGVSLLTSEEGRTYRQCLEDAAGDPAAIEQCTREFEERLRDNPS